MLKKSLIALGIAIIGIAGASSAALAGQGRASGYDPLWWNGPAGYDHTDLFENRGYRGGYGPSYSKRSGCQVYERNFLRTGKDYWLRKYEICKAG